MKNLNFDFVGKRKIWYAISVVIIIAGIISMAIQGLNFGIDFTGGSYVQLSFSEKISLEDLRGVVNAHVEKTPTIQYDETNDSYIIRTELTEEDSVNELLAAIEAEFGEFQVDRNELVGPTIGAELVKKAILALIIACGSMLIYITFRFQFWFGISSIIALLHDALVVLAVFSIFQLEVSSSFIAAILTVIGYSINATIVLFDRVRESSPNFKAAEKLALVNDSINNTLARSINTTLTTLLTLLALFFFGGDTTQVFVLAMIVGIAAGFYSSVFVSGSLYFDLSKFAKKRK
ncbi:MAG: protein translocase subunit SecF [Firmicutes bacterium]|nr:protein translocase subunit SecF [Bacillota bacterium]